jgi:hypothetical protein
MTDATQLELKTIQATVIVPVEYARVTATSSGAGIPVALPEPSVAVGQ